jgi:hypothetical protein
MHYSLWKYYLLGAAGILQHLQKTALLVDQELIALNSRLEVARYFDYGLTNLQQGLLQDQSATSTRVLLVEAISGQTKALEFAYNALYKEINKISS